MGGDHAPGEIVRGALLAVRELGVDVAVTGPERLLRAEARAAGGEGLLAYAEASEVVTMDEHAAAAARHKRDSSIAVGLQLVKDGRAAAFVSAGNTGAVMATALFTLGRARGIERPAIAAPFPALRPLPVLLLDVGANADARPGHLVQFAELGAAYARAVFGIAEPTVGLLNIGEEETKGNQLALEAHRLLKETATGFRFVGNVEGKDVIRGAADVVVTDGFTGNVFIKAAEGLGEMIAVELRSALRSRPDTLLGGLLARPALQRLRRRLDYSEYGGAPLLGVAGTVIIAHGRSRARAVRNALRAARDAAGAVWSLESEP